MAGGDGGEDVVVKSEFILVREKEKEKENTNDKPKKEDNSDNNGQSNKSKKGKGRNKDRPPPVKFDRASKLCPILVDISENTKEPPKCQFPNCAFQHDVKKYLENRKTPEEMGMAEGNRCPVFDKLGKCARGATCIFHKAHVVLGEDEVARNKVDAGKVERVGKEEANHLEKELQQKLWKKKIDFKKVDEIVDRAYKNREESMKAKEKGDAEDELKPPPEKMVKVEEIGRATA